MWTQNYTPISGNVALSACMAALPLCSLLYVLGVRRWPAWRAALIGLGVALVVATVGYRMPAGLAVGAMGFGAAHGLLPIGWVVFASMLLYRVTVEAGQFEIIRESVGRLSGDRRMQALLIAFGFGAFIEGAAGFGAPVAVAAAMLTGLGFNAFEAAALCLLANTAPVAFGSIGTPIWTLSKVTGLPLGELSAAVGRICAPVSLFVPMYLILVQGGWRALRGVLPAVVACGVTFAGAQYFVSGRFGPELTDILGSLSAMGVLVLISLVWKPKDREWLQPTAGVVVVERTAFQLWRAWMPYLLLVVFVFAWGHLKPQLGSTNIKIPWLGLDGRIMQVAPIAVGPAPYRAVYDFAWLASPGTACFFAALGAAVALGLSPRRFLGVFIATARQLALPMLTVVSVLALAFLMNYSGATATLGLAFAGTGKVFPFFSALLGWLGVFLTGSDTSANALFGGLQVVTAQRLGLDPVLMAAANSSGGVMGKMISLQSIAVAVAASGLRPSDEGGLFRFTLKHSVFLACVIGVLTMLYAAA